MGRLIQAARGPAGRVGGPRKRVGFAAWAAIMSRCRAAITPSARPVWTSAGVSMPIPACRWSRLYQARHWGQKSRASSRTEIAAAMADRGLPSGLHRAAADVFRGEGRAAAARLDQERSGAWG